MRNALIGFGVAAPLLLMITPAQAQTPASDPVAKSAIVQGDYVAAERRLIQELRIHPGRPELLLNLAAVYSQTGRVSEARGLYRQVIAQNDVLMDVSADRTAGSHTIATTGLRRLETVQFTQR
ncbi:tetratricopeptide repeat protein [Sphingomonas sp. HF-S3]|uniref:Tetratricopeptide repeat protein n=1 Tax=Sphingomonas rustica TaxID=3103142 RepID=A0ABV0B4L0_9SPHN